MPQSWKPACRAVLAIVLVVALAGRVRAVTFTPGDLVVSTYGSAGSNITQGASTPISLIEFAVTNGSATMGESPVFTDQLPTTNSGNNLGIVGQYGSSSEGTLQLSGNGQYLTIAGYSASAAAGGIDASTNSENGTSYANGTPFSHNTVSLAQSTDTNVPRLAALIDANGNVNSSTELNDVYSTNNPRSVYSSTGSTFYISGQGDGNASDQGVFYGNVGLNTTSGGGAPAGIYNAQDTRTVTAYNGNLYFSIDTGAGTDTGIWKYTGLPTTSSTPTRIIPANNGKSGGSEVFYSPEGFYFANASTLYVADTGDPKAGDVGDGGIQKWTLNGNTWSLQYTLTPNNSAWTSSDQTGFEALAGEVVGSGASAQVDLFAVSYTSGNGDPDGLFSISDTLNATTGAGESFTEIESAAGNTDNKGGELFKGVAFAPAVPEPATLSLLSFGSVALLKRRRGISPRSTQRALR
jgi:hypothetical protein